MRRTIGLAAVLMVGLAAKAFASEPNSEVLKLLASYPENPLLIERMRERGQSAIDQLFEIRGQIERQLEKVAAAQPPVASEIEALTRHIANINEIMDRVGKQRYCSRSRLVLAHQPGPGQNGRPRKRQADSQSADARQAGRRLQLRQQPLLPDDAVRQRGNFPDAARELHPALAKRPAGAQGDDRLWRRAEARADAHRQQHPLHPDQRRRRGRSPARPVRSAGVPDQDQRRGLARPPPECARRSRSAAGAGHVSCRATATAERGLGPRHAAHRLGWHTQRAGRPAGGCRAAQSAPGRCRRQSGRSQAAGRNALWSPPPCRPLPRPNCWTTSEPGRPSRSFMPQKRSSTTPAAR